jgi:hypothetical protein
MTFDFEKLALWGRSESRTVSIAHTAALFQDRAKKSNFSFSLITWLLIFRV